MSGEHDDDLRDLFSGLLAPRSMSRYASRIPVAAPSAGPLRRRRRWSPLAAAAVAVVIAVGGAVTFVGVRTARQASPSAGATSTPPARSYAAMAYDSVGGVTVMFGGSGISGARLADTWTWDGSSWTRLAGASPPAMVQPEMADDPVDGGVLLVGSVAAAGGAVSCSGQASAPAATVGPPAGAAPASSATGGSGRAAIAPLPAIPSIPEPGIVTVPPIICGGQPASTTQTWVLDTHGWREVAAGSTAPPTGSPVARVPGSGQVVAVASTGVPVLCTSSVPCGSPDAPAVAAPGVCELTMSGGCPAYSAPLRTWVWSSDHWSKTPSNLEGAGSEAELVPTADGNSLELLTARFTLGYFCNNLAGGCPQTLPSGTSAWRWSGHDWQPDRSGLTFPPGSGGTLASSGGRALLLTSTGETWVGPSGGWAELASPPGLDRRTGAALGGDRDGGFVLFGGLGAVGPGAAPGSDTWVFASGGWRHVAGAAPATPAPLRVCPVTGGAPLTPCATEILPQRPAATAPNPCFQQDCLP